MHELETHQYTRAKPVFARLLFATSVSAVFEGSSPARVFVDDQESPSMAFLWTRWGYFYIAGPVRANPGVTARFIERLSERLQAELIPDSVRAGERWPVLFPDGPGWEEHVPAILGARQARRLARRTFSSFHSPPLVDVSAPGRGETAVVQPRVLGPGQVSKRRSQNFMLRRIDEALLHMHPALATAVDATWISREEFKRRGFGFCILLEDQVVASCHTCFAAGRRVEIQIATSEPWRRRGLGQIAALAFLKECADRNLTPTWECWWNNTPSTILAERLGFGAPVDHPVFWWEEPA